MSSCSKFNELLPMPISKIERFRNEFNKNRIYFPGNGCELIFLSAHGDAERLMGEGGDVVVDESCLIENDNFPMISRMLGDYPDSMFVEITNPWHKFNHVWRHWNNLNYNKIRIDYNTGIREGRISKEFIEEMRLETDPIKFKVFYEADFPDDTEDTLIRFEWIDNSLKSDLKIDSGEFVYGLDCAELGQDLNVLTKFIKSTSNHYVMLDAWFIGKKDTMEVSNWAVDKIGNDKKSNIYVDSNGVGAGVFARLKELGYKSNRIISSNSATIKDLSSPDFSNFKAQAYWNLRRLFEGNKIKILDVGSRESTLKSELNSLRYCKITGGKVKIIDPSDSPDFADSVMLATCGCLQRDYFMVFA
jgi:hypothetical protein